MLYSQNTVDNETPFLAQVSIQHCCGPSNNTVCILLDSQATARKLGLGMALVGRLCLLMGIAWIASLTQPLFTLLGKSFSGRDLILLLGGLFLIAKATHEIYEKLEGADGETDSNNKNFLHP